MRRSRLDGRDPTLDLGCPCRFGVGVSGAVEAGQNLGGQFGACVDIQAQRLSQNCFSRLNHDGDFSVSPLDVQSDMSAKTMEKQRGRMNCHAGADPGPEHRFDYTKSRPNRFAGRIAKNAVVVVLDPDVAAVFRDPKRVNSLLRATIAALKKPGSRRAG